MKTVNGVMTLIQEYACDYHDGYYAKATANRLAKLRTAIEELYRDSARYKWLRMNDWATEGIVEINFDELEHLTGVELDAAIDMQSNTIYELADKAMKGTT